jgi:hypothetical protein
MGAPQRASNLAVPSSDSGGVDLVEVQQYLFSVPFKLVAGAVERSTVYYADLVPNLNSPLLNEPSPNMLLRVLAAPAVMPGVYYWDRNTTQWRYVYPFAVVNNALFYSSERYFVLPNDGQTVIPISSMKSTDTEVTIYKNGQITTAFTLGTGSLTMTQALRSTDILMIERRTSEGSGSGGGGIPDVTDTDHYLRTKGAWVDIKNETLDEGSF